MISEIIEDAKSQMNLAITALKKQLAQIRTGRASPSLLDGMKVDYYGTPTPLTQVAGVTVPEARTLMIKPWEKPMLKLIEKAILESNLGLSPNNDGECIRINMPALTEERRKEFVRQSKQKCEDGRVSVRNIRRDCNEMVKDAKKSSEINEDDEKRGLKMVQDITDKFISDIETLGQHKEQEIMTV